MAQFRKHQLERDNATTTVDPANTVRFDRVAGLAGLLLATSESLYRTLIEHIPAITYLAAPDDPGSLLFSSPQIAGLLGFTVEEWLVDPHFWHSRLHPDDLERVRESDQQALRNGEAYDLEYRLIHRDGRPLWFRDQGLLIRDDDNAPLFWLGTTVDITAQMDTEHSLRDIETRYRTLVEQIPVVTYIEFPNSGGVPHFISPQMEELLGYSAEQWNDDPGLWVEAIHPDDRAAWQEEIASTDEAGDAFDLEYRMVAANGSVVWVRSSAQLVRDADGTPRFWQGILQDTTDQVLAEKRLAENEQRYRSLFDHNPDAVYSFDLQGMLLSLNGAFEELSGYSRDEAIGQSYTLLVCPEDVDRVAQHFIATAHGAPQNYECGVLRKDGSRIDLNITNLPIVVGGDIVGVYGIAKDISGRKALEEQLRRQAFHDPLTDLPNRLLFTDRLKHALAGLQRNQHSIAVLFIDLDNFKAINDSFGHEVGDRVLQDVAGIIQSCIRPTDTASRLGGDEYTVLLNPISCTAEAVAVARRLMHSLKSPITPAGHEITITPSIGIVVSSSPDDDPGALLRHADLAMYHAKALGKARYEVFDPSNPTAFDRTSPEYVASE